MMQISESLAHQSPPSKLDLHIQGQKEGNIY